MLQDRSGHIIFHRQSQGVNNPKWALQRFHRLGRSEQWQPREVGGAGEADEPVPTIGRILPWSRLRISDGAQRSAPRRKRHHWLGSLCLES